MDVPKAFFKIFLILFSFYLSAYPAFAADNAGFIFSADNNDRSVFGRRDVRLAVDQFCRSLSLDPSDKTVQENLRAIVSLSQVSATQKSDTLLLEDQLNYIQNLQQRISYLISKRSMLRAQLMAGGYDPRTLIAGLTDIRNNISGSQKSFSYPERSLSERVNPLVAINNLLTKEKLHLAVQVHTLESQYDWLKAIQKNERYGPSDFSFELIVPENFKRFEEQAEAYSPGAEDYFSEELEAFKRVVVSMKDAKETFPKKKGETIVSLTPIVYEGEETQEYQQEAWGDKGGRDELQRQIIDLSLRLSEVENQLNKKAESVSSLRHRLTEAEQRFILGQKIIQEKDEELQSLQEDLKRSRVSVENQAKVSHGREPSEDRQLAEMEAFLKVSRDNLARTDEALKAKIENLRVIKEKLADAQQQVRLSQAAVQGRLGEMRDLQRGEVAVRSLVSADPGEVDHFLNGQNRILMELNAFLNIYRQGLGEANHVIQQKDVQIKMLEEELTRFQKKMALYQKQDEKKDYQIRILKEKLLSEKDKREQRNIHLRNVVRERDEKIKALKEQLAVSERNFQAVYQTIQEKGAYLNYVRDELTALKGQRGSGDKRLSQLNGMLDIYKGKLFEEKKSAQEKTASITALERQLKAMENQLSEKGEALVRTQSYLRDLEGKLTDMKQELLRLKDGSEEHTSFHNNVDQVGELQSKFEDINEFLLENLHDSDRIKSHLVIH